MLKTILDPDRPVEVNGLIMLLSVILLHLIGPQAMMVQPAFVEGMVSQLGFTEVAAGKIAATENFGKAIQSLLMMILIARVNWRHLYYVALTVLLVGNMACFFIDTPGEFRVIRFMTGMATGTIVPLSYVIVGLTAATERNYGFFMISLMIYGAIVFFALPSVFSAVGFNGLIVIFAAFAVLGFPVVRNVPRAGQSAAQTGHGGATIGWPLRVMAALAMFVYFLATFSVWVFMSLIGKNSGLEEQTVATIMMLTQFAGIVGAVIVIAMGDRAGRGIPIAVAITGSIIALYVVGTVNTMLGFAIGACTFNLFWNTTHPYLLAAQARFDRSGRQSSYAVAMQMAGVAAGPWVGSTILETGGTYWQIILVAIILLVATIVLIEPPIVREYTTRKNAAISDVELET